MDKALQSIIQDKVGNGGIDVVDKENNVVAYRNMMVYSEKKGRIVMIGLGDQKKRLGGYTMSLIDSLNMKLLEVKEYNSNDDKEYYNESNPMDIKEVILHPGNNEQICIVTQSHIIIKSNIFSSSIKDSIIPIKSLCNEGNNESIRKIKFAYFDNVISVLFTNNIFRIYTIDTNQSLSSLELLAEISNFNDQTTDFVFGSFNKTNPGWESFMIYFLSIKGHISTCGPFFPQQFKFDRINFINMKHHLNDLNSLSQQLYLALEKSMISNLIPAEDDYCFFSINNQLENWNRHLSARGLVLRDNVFSQYERELNTMQYNQLDMITSDPFVFLLRISNQNQVDIIGLFEKITPERKWYNVIENNQTQMTMMNKAKGNFLMEIIYLKQANEAIAQFSWIPMKIIHYNQSHIILEHYGNVYSVQLPYIASMKNLELYNQFTINNSITRTIISRKPQKVPFNTGNSMHSMYAKQNIVSMPPLNYFMLELIENKLMIVKHYNKTLQCRMIPFPIVKPVKQLPSLTMRQTFEESSTGIDSIKPEIPSIIEKNINIPNQLNDEEIAFDPKNKSIIKAMRHNVFENILQEQVESLAHYYQNIFNRQADALKYQCRTIKETIDLVNTSNITEAYDYCQKQLKEIREKQTVINEQNSTIINMIGNIKQKVSDIKCNSKPVLAAIAIVEQYENDMQMKINSIAGQLSFYEREIRDMMNLKHIDIDIDMHMTTAYIYDDLKVKAENYNKQIKEIKDNITISVKELII